jgi:predicted ATPase/transcriptional regulator with XRE-family HTH domain
MRFPANDTAADMNESDSFGQWLKFARRARDLTREALADLVSCAPPTLAKIEQGSRRPSRELATLLVEALQVPLEQRVQVLQLARLSLSEPRATKQASNSAGEPNRTQGAPLGSALRAPALPAAPTPLIGRAAEQAEVLRRLSDPACRLLTLVGPGGIGKTRLALQAATAAPFADGVAWVELATLSAAAHVAPAIAAAVGCALAGAEAPDAQLLAWLCDRRQLIVLDNLEHLLDAAPLLAVLLRQAPGVTLLATSRERLRIQGEWVVEVHGLAVPDEPRTIQRGADHPVGTRPQGQPRTADEVHPTHSALRDTQDTARSTSVDLERYDAVLLFLARARQARGDFALTPANRQAIAWICRLLDGMPLGIELAATWTRLMTCQEIADEIARSLDFLSRADRDTPARHHSMRAVFDHSWQLLTEDERRALAAFSVFRGGCRQEAAQQVASATLPTLAALVDKSLVRATRETTGVSRYDLHELIRQYAADRLGADAEAQQAVAARHSHYYAALLHRQLPDLFSARRDAVFAALEPELDNLRQAWGWAVGQCDTTALGMMGQALQSIYEDCGWLQEGAVLFGLAEQALRAAVGENGGGSLDMQRTLGQLLGRHGYFLSRCGQFAAAWELLQESLALLRDGERSLALADTLMNLGFVAYQQGEYAAARGWLHESVTIAGALNEHFYQGLGLSFLGMVALAQGQHDEARARFAQALAIGRVNGQPRGLTIALSFLGRTVLAQGCLDEAQALLEESVAVSARAHDRWGMGCALHHLGMLALAQGEATEAQYLTREAADLFAALSDQRAYGLALASLGDTALALDDAAAARQAFTDALRLAVEDDILPVRWHALLGVATLHARDHRLVDAYALVLVIGQHPALDHAVRTRTEQLRAEIATILPAPARRAATDQARRFSLEQLMIQVAHM